VGVFVLCGCGFGKGFLYPFFHLLNIKIYSSLAYSRKKLIKRNLLGFLFLKKNHSTIKIMN